MVLRTLSKSLALKGKRVLVRVDWNVPFRNGILPEESLKIERSLSDIRDLAKRGAIVIVLTHLGRPKGRERSLSTQHLLPLLKSHYRFPIRFHSASVSNENERAALLASFKEAEPGSVHLLENVRFEKGEEANDFKLAKAYATLGDLFVNDAFASSHRAHVSVVGIAKRLPSYAGPMLADEVNAISTLLNKPKKPFVAIIGGLKVSTKIQVLQSLLSICDRVLVGGAMATTLGLALKRPSGKSFVEKSALALVKTMVKNKKLGLPMDVVVKERSDHPKLRRVLADKVGKKDIVVDVGPRTLAAWGKEIASAKTILWNGPVGVSEVEASGAGSRFLARTIADHAKGKTFAVVGGGDTLPILVATKTVSRFDHVSTGGGALLEFISKKGKLPGLIPLMKK